ncbi:hypothetical protein [Aulosira sp. FACHB-615]|uniref:hypothetical protein n=1 Tax=Aulosira sp. FACHB-615 TaxID=2692777 RepID=UPI001688B3D1|nr:hypothetical protein [Aulosira sp. FACHB-615]MBD2492125.1 hypothetical protein [Aulosira sp. FACHB-615]
MKLLQNVWQDIRSGQNIDAYITIGIAIIIAVLGITGFATSTTVNSAILAVLALVTTALLVSRQENKKLQDAVSRIEKLDHLADKFFGREYDRTELKKFIRTSRKAFFWGLNFTRTIPLLKDDIEYGLENGLEIKFLLMKPASQVVEMAAFRSRDSNVDELNSTLETNISRLLTLSQKNYSGSLEVRCINYLPCCTIVCFDHHLISGRMIARLLNFRVPNEIRATFELTSKDDNYWYNFFVKQFEAVWNAAEPLEGFNANKLGNEG